MELDPVIQRRRLRVGLQRARVHASLTQKEVARRLGWSLSKVIRIETGQVGLSRTDLKAMLDQYGVSDDAQIDEFVRMAEDSRRQPWGPYRDVLNPDFLIYLGFEGAACTIRQFHPLLIPGILQTEEYARKVISTFAAPGTAEDTMRRQLEWRMKRQDILHRADPPTMSFILAEACILQGTHGSSEDAAIMNRQLSWLKDVDTRPHVDITILPSGHELHIGLKGPFVILEFPDPEDSDLLYLENDSKSVATRDDPTITAFYAQAFAALRTASVPVAEMDRLVNKISTR